jgi:hypothetical protein
MYLEQVDSFIRRAYRVGYTNHHVNDVINERNINYGIKL